MTPEAPTQFDYLLNALELASQSAKPAENKYADKRKALFAHVRELERKAAASDATIADLKRRLQAEIVRFNTFRGPRVTTDERILTLFRKHSRAEVPPNSLLTFAHALLADRDTQIEQLTARVGALQTALDRRQWTCPKCGGVGFDGATPRPALTALREIAEIAKGRGRHLNMDDFQVVLTICRNALAESATPAAPSREVVLTDERGYSSATFCPHCNPCTHDGKGCRNPYGDDGLRGFPGTLTFVEAAPSREAQLQAAITEWAEAEDAHQSALAILNGTMERYESSRITASILAEKRQALHHLATKEPT